MFSELEPLLWYAAFVVSVTAHEASHALASYLGGDPTAYHEGQVSLHPLPHMRREPFGMVVIPLLSALTNGWSIGWASTPYDPRWEERHPRRAAWMAAAGPAANLAIAFLALLALRAGLAWGVFHPPDHVSFSHLVGASDPAAAAAATMLSILLVLNAILFLFNLLPLPPLDGATAMTLLLPDSAARRVRAWLRTPQLALFALFAAWMLFGRMVRPLWELLLALVHPDVAYR